MQLGENDCACCSKSESYSGSRYAKQCHFNTLIFLKIYDILMPNLFWNTPINPHILDFLFFDHILKTIKNGHMMRKD